MKALDWEKQGEYHEFDSHKVFVVDTKVGKETLLILHGFPTFSYDYWKVLDQLKQKYRVIIHDHLGFGFSDKPRNYSYSLVDQADIAYRLWQKLGIEKAHLLAHDYGTSVATEIVARRNWGYEPIKLESLTLCNGSMHIELAKLRFSQKLLLSKTLGPIFVQLSNIKTFSRTLRNIWGDAQNLEDWEIEEMWYLLNYKAGIQVLPKINQYLHERKKFWFRWIGGLQKTDLAVNILWAEEDPVAVITMAQALFAEIPKAKLKTIPKIGHYPMLEAPEIWATSLLEMLKPEPS